MNKIFSFAGLIAAVLLAAACGSAPELAAGPQPAAATSPTVPGRLATETALSPTSTPLAEPAAGPTLEPDPTQTLAAPVSDDLPAAPGTEFNPAGLNDRAGRGFIVLDDPVMIPGAAADWLEDDQIVLGVVQNGEAQAFPISQMAYHHIANVTVGGEPYLVTY